MDEPRHATSKSDEAQPKGLESGEGVVGCEPSLGRFGDYELLEEIARGGMGVVYRARDLTVNRIVALKMILAGQFASEREVKRFQAEAEAAAQLDHPHIVPLYEVGQVNGRRFLGMKFIEGQDLVKHLRGTPMDARPVAELIGTLARAVHYAHQRGILHRDLKPANILLDAEGKPHVTDFGLAKFTEKESGLTLTTDVLGSPNYMAPEQAAGKVQQLTTAADVYSLGAIMYEALTGRPPFKAPTPLETMRKVLEEEPIPPHTLYSFVDPDLETICLKCLQKEPVRRYGTALELGEDLERWLRHEPIHARPVSVFERVTKWMRRNPKIATLLILLHLVFAAGLAGILFTSFQLASANREKERANLQLAKNIRDFEWQKIDQLIKTGKRSDALAYLARFLRQNPNDKVAATRLISMMSGCSFAIPTIAPLEHGSGVNTLDISSDGRRLLTATDDGTSRIWQLPEARVVSTLAHSGKVSYAAFVADEKLVLIICQDGSARLWNPGEDKVVLEFPKNEPGNGGVFSYDRRRLALRVSDTSMQLWDLVALQTIGTALKMPSTVRFTSFSPDGQYVAIASDNGSISLWTAKDAGFIWTFKVPGDPTATLFSPDSKTLAACWGGSITFWDVANRAKVQEFKADDGQVLQMDFSPDGKRLVATAYDRHPLIWEVASPRRLGELFQAERPFAFFCLSPDGKRLATRSQSGVVRLWDAFNGKPLSEPFEHEGPVNVVKFSPDGRFVFTGSQDGTVRIWEPQPTPTSGVSIKTTDVYPAACFSKDGRRIFWTTENRAEIYDLIRKERVGKPMVHSGQVYRLALSPDGKKLATAGWDNVGRVWDAQTGEPLTPPLPHRWRLYAIAFSPDNRMVATGSADATALLWNADTGQRIGPELRHESEVMNVQFRPDSKALLTASVDGTARLWSTETGQPLWHEPIRHNGIVWSAEFSPDGRRIVTASADRTAMVWDAQSGRALTSPSRHERGVLHACFSPDGKWILTCSEDGTARVWESATGLPVSQPMRHEDKVAYALFSPNGRLVFTGCQDGTARMWDALTGYAVSEPFHHDGQITGIQFSPDGKSCLSIGNSDAFRLWEVTDSPSPVPAWVCDLAEGIAGRRFNDRGEREPVPSKILQELKYRATNETKTDYYSTWARWFLSDRFKGPGQLARTSELSEAGSLLLH